MKFMLSFLAVMADVTTAQQVTGEWQKERVIAANCSQAPLHREFCAMSEKLAHP